MIGVNGHIPGGKEGQHLAVFGIDVAHVGGKPDPYIIIFTARRMQQCITIIGLNMMWKSHENLEHNIVLACLGMAVFVPTEKALGTYKM